MPIRPLPLVAALLLALALPGRGEEPVRITLHVGERRTLGGYAPVCDDPAVAIITADGAGVLVANGVGRTLCSVQQPGMRRVYEVVVVPEEKKKDGDAPGGARGG